MKWQVWNMHKDGLTHKEVFRGDTIEIPAGKYILMDYEDAVLFKGSYFQPEYDAMGQQTPRSMKMIELKPHGEEKPAVKSKFVCQMDGKEFDSASALAKYTLENYGESGVVDAAAEAELEQEVKTRSKRKTKEG